MRESDFDALISGPPTRKGIAKGMWRFIPETGATYWQLLSTTVRVSGRPSPSLCRSELLANVSHASCGRLAPFLRAPVGL